MAEETPALINLQKTSRIHGQKYARVEQIRPITHGERNTRVEQSTKETKNHCRRDVQFDQSTKDVKNPWSNVRPGSANKTYNPWRKKRPG